MEKEKERRKEWTLMFFFASDNALAPGVVSQLKAIKEAGFHPNVNVVTQFDPRSVGTPTHIFDVNVVEKLKTHGGSNIGFCASDEPFVRDLLEDKLWRNQKTRNQRRIRDEYQRLLCKCHQIEYDPPLAPPGRSGRENPRRGIIQEPSPRESLENFLTFCRTNYPAKHFMLFILGHGVVVGNDIFLFDEHAEEQFLTLRDLGAVLRTFTEEIKAEHADFELISFHSCSVSALEVAYELTGTANELRGTARFMLATQGPAFVGSWPYRQILIRIFKEGSNINVKKLVIDIFYLCLYNSTDFMLAGYSFDLCLCNLEKVRELTYNLKRLSRALIAALPPPLPRKSDQKRAAPLPCDPALDAASQPAPSTIPQSTHFLARSFILLAHLKAQSYWQESYTDIVDFCCCLVRLIDEYQQKSLPPLPGALCEIREACEKVMEQLVKEGPEKGRPKNQAGCKDKIIVRAEYAGPAYQYSNGLSVFFPWSEPEPDNPIWSRPDVGPPFVGEYEKYAFEITCWRAFLVRYFEATRRETRREEEEDYGACIPEDKPGDTRKQEDKPCGGEGDRPDKPEGCDFDEFDRLREDMASLIFNDQGPLSNESSLSKPIPDDPTGDECTCPSIKNYPRDTRARREREKQAPDNKAQELQISETFFFRLDRDKD